MTDILMLDGELVLTERQTTNEFMIIAIHESIINQFVNVEVELGPFTDNIRPDGSTFKSGTARRSVNAWQGAEYEVIKDTWDNTMMIAKVSELLNLQITPI